MKRKILSILLSIILVIAAVTPAFIIADAAVWTGSRSVPGISGGVYQIANGENLAWFANAVNTGTNTIKGELVADIQLNSTGSTAHEWTPIGTSVYPFKGTFDGNGHTVSGVYIDSNSDNVGLFGFVSYPQTTTEPEDISAEYTVGTKTYSIKNINVTDSSVTGKQNVGGIVGYASNAGILECSYSGTVTGTENSVGGIVGWATVSTVVSQCHSTGSVTGHQRTGGTAGYANGNSVITKCYGDMDVTGYTNVGGTVGTLSSAGLLGCFFLGSVSANDRAGGLVGYSAFGTMKSSYTIPTITNTSDNGTDFGGAVGVIYGGEYLSIFYCYESSGVDGPVGLGRTRAEMKMSDFVREVNHTSPFFCYDYTGINNDYPVLTWMLKLDVWAGDQTMPQRNYSGTYLISKPSELAWFAGLVNGTLSGITQNSAANATVTDNLLFNIDVNDDTMGRIEWTPIGTSASPYTGTFNGGGYNLAGIYTSENSGESGANTGLFGYIGTGGNVSGVVVIDGLFCGRENVGGIAGYVSGGTVTNCICDSEVCGDKSVGGIVGNLGSASSTVTFCGMIGSIKNINISGEQSYLQNIGGVVGYSNRAVVSKSFASANVNTPLARYVGGVMGNNSGGSVTSCYSTSTVSGNNSVGGIMGFNNNGTVQKCYTAGKVTGSSKVGIAFGDSLGSNVSGCYFDESFKTLSTQPTGATSKLPTQMTGSYSVSNLGLGSDFKATADDTYFYYYPQIYSMAYSSLNAVKNASLESVKRVQNKYVARVEIDGRTDTYYETLPAAFSYAASTPSTVLPTVFLVRDITLTSTLNISSTVGFFGENGAVLTRDESLTGAMIKASGNLTIGSSVYGYDDSPDLYINGNDVAATESAIVMQSGATLKIQEGVYIHNCRTASTAVRGAAVSISDGELIMTGGTFDTNISKTVGGAIYAEESNVTISRGTFTACEATQGCGLYNNNGNAVVSGGTFSGNLATLYGGAIAGYGVYSTTTVSGAAVLTGNEATYGGALSVQNYGTLEVGGGTISSNTAYLQGGAIYIDNGAEAVISGGLIENNVAYNVSNPAYGNGIYNNGSLSLKGTAQIDSSNDVYLPSGKYITIPDRITCSGYAATVTPAVYSEGIKVLDGSGIGSYYTKFGLSNTNWRILASGKITSRETANVAVLSKNNSYSVEYVTLADAFAAVNDGDTAIITVIADNTINSTITVRGDVTLVCDDVSFTSMRSGSFYGVMFDIRSGATLRLGDSVLNSNQQAQSDYAAGTRTDGQIIIDGGNARTDVVGAAAVNVQSGGTFYMYDDAIIENCANTTTSTVTVSGTMHMYGGTICNNSSHYGGAITVNSTGELNTYGGVIDSNESQTDVGAVYALGKVVRNINSYDFYFVDAPFSGESGDGGDISDPVYQTTFKTDILITDGEAVYLDRNLVYTEEASSAVYITNLSQLPASTLFVMNPMMISLKKYTVGSVVVTGTNVATYYTGFTPCIDGYYILNNGKLGINKLVAKSNSGLRIDRDKNLISGLDMSVNTVNVFSQKFENDRTLLRFYSPTGATLRTTNTLTTGCRVCLVDASNTAIDTLTIVVYGDVNSDELIDGQDAVLARAAAEGMLTSVNASAAQLEACDVNADGMLTLMDSEHIEACGIFMQTIEQAR